MAIATLLLGDFEIAARTKFLVASDPTRSFYGGSRLSSSLVDFKQLRNRIDAPGEHAQINDVLHYVVSFISVLSCPTRARAGKTYPELFV